MLMKKILAAVLSLAVAGCAAASFTPVAVCEDRVSDYFYGDVNRDGSVTAADALLTLQYAVKKVDLENEQLYLADVNGSGRVISSDALLILQFVVKKLEKFEVGEHPVIKGPFANALGLMEGRRYKVTNYNKILTLNTPDSNYRNIQGGYFDGEKYVIALTKGSMRNNDEVGIIAVYDETGKLIKSSRQLDIQHGNNISYVPKENAYLVSHCQPGWNCYSFVDADTLEVKKTGALAANFFSMAYSPERDMYASGQGGGDKLHIWDGNMNLVGEFPVKTPTSLSQGVYCDKDYIYFVRSHNGGSTYSEIRIYDWNGILKFVIDLDRWNSWATEPESINIVDAKVYIIARENGVAVYKIDIAEDKSEQ